MEIILLLYSGVLLVLSLIFLSMKKKLAEVFAVLFFVLSAVFLSYIAIKHNPLFNMWMQEDIWAEWATFFTFSAAAILSIILFFHLLYEKKQNNIGWITLIIPLGLATFCIFVAGEELSWGQRLFGFKPPNIFLEQNFQQELNVHNFFTKKDFHGIDLDTRFLVSYICISYGILGSILSFIWPFKKSKAWMNFTFPSIWISPLFAFIAWVELEYPLKRAGEASEFLLGIVFLIDAIRRYNLERPIQTISLVKKYAVWLIIPIILGIAAPKIVYAINSIGNNEKSEQARKELNQIKNDLLKRGTILNKLKRKSYVHKRIYTSIVDGYLRYSNNSEFLEYMSTPAEKNSINPRKDRIGYFLDPWNNAYWIVYVNKTKKIFIYSFGPNRRRDLDFSRRDPELVEDDIAIVFELPRY